MYRSNFELVFLPPPPLPAAVTAAQGLFINKKINKKKYKKISGGRGGHPEHIPVFRALLETTDPHQKRDSIHAKMRTRSVLFIYKSCDT